MALILSENNNEGDLFDDLNGFNNDINPSEQVNVSFQIPFSPPSRNNHSKTGKGAQKVPDKTLQTGGFSQNGRKEKTVNQEMISQIEDAVSAAKEMFVADDTLEEGSILEKENIRQRKKERKALEGLKNLKLYPFLTDGNISKLYIQNYKNIHLEKNNKKEECTFSYMSEDEFLNEMDVLSGLMTEKCVDTPYYVEFIITGGIRIAKVSPPLSTSGTMATITLPNTELVKSRDFIKKEVIGREMLYFLERCVRGNINIVISGNAREEQVEFLNLLNSFIPETDTVITIDPKCELYFSHNNAARLDSSKFNGSYREDFGVFHVAEQLKPDRIVLSEVNSGNVMDFIRSASMNNKNYMTTIYANSAKNMCNHRIPLLARIQLNTKDKLEYLPEQLNDCIQLIVHIAKMPYGGVKVLSIVHADGINSEGNVNLKEIFTYNRQGETFVHTGYIPKKLVKIIKDQGITFDEEIFKKDEKGRKEYYGL